MSAPAKRGRTPDFNVSVVLQNEGSRWSKIGAAWHNEDGSISIVLDPFISLGGRMPEEYSMRLYRNDTTGLVDRATRADRQPGPRIRHRTSDSLFDDEPGGSLPTEGSSVPF